MDNRHVPLSSILLDGIERQLMPRSFVAGGLNWLSFNGRSVPSGLMGFNPGHRVFFLLASGAVTDCTSQEQGALEARFGRSRSDSIRVVGWRKEEIVKELPARFEKDGYWWTPCDNTKISECPVDLMGVQGHGWLTLFDKKDRPNERSEKPTWQGYWGEDSGFSFTAYCVIGRDEVKKPEPKPARKTFEAHGHTWFDCSEDRTCPEELKNTVGRRPTLDGPGDWEYISENWKNRGFCAFKGAADEAYENNWATGSFLGFRLIQAESAKPAKAEHVPFDPNAAMIEADKVKVAALAKDPSEYLKAFFGGSKAPAPLPVEVHPLHRVAPISARGFSLWGAEHFEE